MKQAAAPDLAEAFPEHLRSSARIALAGLPQSPTTRPRSSEDIGLITLGGQQLRIPARIYAPEPNWPSVQWRDVLEESIVGCLYTRHHDGHVRERALMHVRAIDDCWIAPFVIQLLGEYVLEVVERAASLLENPPRQVFVRFLRENPSFLELTSSRATSYWNAYYRHRFPTRQEYPALTALGMLRNHCAATDAHL